MSSHVSGSNNNGGFPLRANFFRSLPLTPNKNRVLYRAAKDNAIACLNQSFNDQWRYVPPEKDGTQIRKDTSNLSASFRLVRAATVLRCQEHEVNMVISNTNTESWREFMQKSFGKHYVDTMILHQIPPVAVKDLHEECGSSTSLRLDRLDRLDRAGSDPNANELRAAEETDSLEDSGRTSLWKKSSSCANLMDDDRSTALTSNLTMARASDTSSQGGGKNPNQEESEDNQLLPVEEHLTVKWGVFDTGVSGRRDACVIDYVSCALVPNTETDVVNLWCFTSVEGERVGCMELKDTHGVARANLTKLGVFWRSISDEETEVIICGSFPSKHAKLISSIMLSCLNKLQSIVEDLRLSNQIYIHRSTWVKDSERSSCHLCMRNFYTLRRKHHCRKCGEVICSDCSLVENVDLPVIGYSKLRLCKVCCVKAKSTPLKRAEKSNVFDHLVRARSLSNANALAPFPRSSYLDPPQNGSHPLKEGRLMDSSDLSSSFSSNNNEFELPQEAVEDHSMSNRGGLTGNQCNRTGTPHPEDYDDFIDSRFLKSQLTAMQEQRQQKGEPVSNSTMFDLLCELACQTLNCPIASVSIMDQEGDGRQRIRSAAGLDDNPALDEELHQFIDKIMGTTPSIVLDANLDKQVQQIFRGQAPPSIRFFAGCPIYSRTGKRLGYVCVADTNKRDTLGASCAFTMERLASLAVTTMDRNSATNKPNGGNSMECDNHPAMIFDRPVNSSRGSGNAARVYEVHDEEIPIIVGSPHYTSNQPTAYANHYAPQHNSLPPTRTQQDFSPGYYEAQERMRKLLLKSYHTQQQLATGGGGDSMQNSPRNH